MMRKAVPAATRSGTQGCATDTLVREHLHMSQLLLVAPAMEEESRHKMGAGLMGQIVIRSGQQKPRSREKQAHKLVVRFKTEVSQEDLSCISMSNVGNSPRPF